MLSCIMSIFYDILPWEGVWKTFQGVQKKGTIQINGVVKSLLIKVLRRASFPFLFYMEENWSQE